MPDFTFNRERCATFLSLLRTGFISTKWLILKVFFRSNCRHSNRDLTRLMIPKVMRKMQPGFSLSIANKEVLASEMF